ncbi:MAG: DoxX family protein [Bacteroidales bacterium]|nr:DoxX family protein [Candidatus Cacconaster merdequi]
MKIIRGFSRIVFALVFILSGIFKLIDPAGTGLIVQEYLNFMHLSFLGGIRIWIGVLLASLEFTVGISVMVGLKMRITATAGFVMTIFFTAVTIVLVAFDPIDDCGCFGEAIHLTNTQSLIKNIVLLVMATVIFIGRKECVKIAPEWLQWCFLSAFLAFALYSAIYIIISNPKVEFTAYRVGTDLNDLYSEGQAQFETVFIYEKDGQTKDFTLSNLPDSTWTYVDSRTEMTGGSTEMALIDFHPHTLSGNYFAASVYDSERIPQRIEERIRDFRFRCGANGVEMRVYRPGSSESGYEADWKSLMTLNRSNGGITYFSDGVIVKKWSASQIDDIDIAGVVSEDPDVLVLKGRIDEQIYISTVVLGILLLLLLLRYFCGMFSKTSSKK